MGRIAAEFPMVQVLREDGSADERLLPDLTAEQMRSMYRWMVLARTFDQRCVTLQRQGRMGTYPPLHGEEAAQVGSAFALERDDWMFPSYREHASLMIHGLPMEQVILYWKGREEGSRPPEGVNVFTYAIPIATQIPHAVGVAWGMKLRGHRRVVLVYFGDGATSEGDFHEGCNFAAVFKVPCVLFCRNNQYAISVPVSRQTVTETLAQKAVAYGIPGVRVDGNDVLAVYRVTREAVERARSGEGPTLIEAYTYRIGPHTTVDDPTRYRREDEVREWREKRDPIARFRRFLTARGLWSDAEEERLQAEVREEVARAVEAAERAPDPDPLDMFEHVYAELPWNLKEQRDELRRELERRRRGGAA